MDPAPGDVSQLDRLVPLPPLRHRLDGPGCVRREGRGGRSLRRRRPCRVAGPDAQLGGSGRHVPCGGAAGAWGWQRQPTLGLRQLPAGHLLGPDGAHHQAGRVHPPVPDRQH